MNIFDFHQALQFDTENMQKSSLTSPSINVETDIKSVPAKNENFNIV